MDDLYKGKRLLTEMFKIERTESRPRTGLEVLTAAEEEQIGLAVECAFERYVERGPRVAELYGGLFCIARAPRHYV